MHFDNKAPTPPASPGEARLPWYRGLSGYMWFVFIVASLCWLFDTMDQQLFNLARKPAITELLQGSSIEHGVTAAIEQRVAAGEIAPDAKEAAFSKAFNTKVDEFGTYATSIFVIGWALGGIFFGILGDKIGRARTLLLTVLVYSGCTGLSALSQGFWDFSLYRLMTGLGVGGVFSAAVSLVAEVMPERSRTMALGMLQALSAVGNMMAASVGIGLGLLQAGGSLNSVWRIYFLIGLAPAILAIPIMARLKEPEKWKAAAKEEEQEEAIAGEPKHKLGSMKELFSDPTLRRHTIFGMLLAFSGVVGLWGIGFFSFDLIRTVFTKHFQAQGLSPQEIAGKLTLWTGIASLVQNGGAFFGVTAFTWVTQNYLGRRPTFAISFIAALLATALTFWTLDSLWQIFVLIPLMGFCQLTLFGGYAIYFPELFPTRLRSTGTSFCYNVGRLVSAIGPFALGLLTSRVFAGYPEPMRYAGVTMSAVFLIGLFALLFLPETKGKPLPE